jgi:Fe-S-cluster formation regulator IscX/YfhJ
MRRVTGLGQRVPLTDSQWASFRARMEELANAKPDAEPSTVRDSYLAGVVLLLVDRLDDIEQRLSPSAARAGSEFRGALAALKQEDWDAFRSEYGEYVMDGWTDLRAFRTALGSLLVRLERKQEQRKGGRKRA